MRAGSWSIDTKGIGWVDQVQFFDECAVHHAGI